MQKSTSQKIKNFVSKPQVSIVTPSYNQGQFIEQTINSVLSQEGDFYIDYIIADGGSTDNSVEIIKKYDELLKTKKYPIKCRGISYRWWSEKDRGQSHAINKGFKIAKGNILAWINSDDVYLFTDSVSKAVTAFQKNRDTDVIFGDLAFIDRRGQILRFYGYQKFNYEKLVCHRYNIGQQAVFFRDKVLKDNELREDLDYVMDYEFWLRLGKKYKFDHIPEALAGFRGYKESKTGREKNGKFLEERKKILAEYSSREENNFLTKAIDKISRGGNARFKGLVSLIRYKYIKKIGFVFNGHYLRFPYDIIRQLFGKIDY